MFVLEFKKGNTEGDGCHVELGVGYAHLDVYAHLECHFNCCERELVEGIRWCAAWQSSNINTGLEMSCSKILQPGSKHLPNVGPLYMLALLMQRLRLRSNVLHTPGFSKDWPSLANSCCCIVIRPDQMGGHMGLLRLMPFIASTNRLRLQTCRGSNPHQFH